MNSAVAPAGPLTSIAPMPRYRWAARTHAVETTDGSLGLHVYASAAGSGAEEAGAEAAGADGEETLAAQDSERRLQITVLVDYRPVAADIAIWNAARTERVAHVRGETGIYHQTVDDGAAADIWLPAGTIPPGRWREVQTVVEFAPADRERVDADVRRWIVFTGSHPPDTVACIVSKEPGENAKPGTRLRRESEGLSLELNLEADRLAFVPLRDARPVGSPQFVEGRAGRSVWRGQMSGASARGLVFVPVWKDPFDVDAGSVPITNFASSGALLED